MEYGTGPKEVLSDALDILNTHGWRQGKYFTGDYKDDPICVVGAGPYCVVGAIIMTLVKRQVYSDAASLKLLSMRILKESVGCEATLEQWNDDPETTFEDVALAFKQAIYELDQKEG